MIMKINIPRTMEQATVIVFVLTSSFSYEFVFALILSEFATLLDILGFEIICRFFSVSFELLAECLEILVIVCELI